MKTAARIWLIAALTECIIYAFFFKEIEVVPAVAFIALVGGFPGMLAMAFGTELVDMCYQDRGPKKWLLLILLTLLTANGTLLLFLLVIGINFSRMEFAYFLIVSISALAGFSCSLSSLRRHYFRHETEPLDLTHQSPYQFNQDYDKN